MTRKTSTYAPIAALAVALLTSAPALAANTVKPAPAPGPSEKEGCEGTINYCGWQALEYATVSGVPVYYYVNGVTMQDGIGGQDSLGYATWTDILQVGPGSNTNNGNPVSLAMSSAATIAAAVSADPKVSAQLGVCGPTMVVAGVPNIGVEYSPLLCGNGNVAFTGGAVNGMTITSITPVPGQ